MSKGHSFKDADSNKTEQKSRDPLYPPEGSKCHPKEEACPPSQENLQISQVPWEGSPTVTRPSTQEDSELKGCDAQ